MTQEEISKSERKRQAQRLKSLGAQLAELSDEQRAALALPADLAQAIDAYRQIRAHEAKRRQGQYIGRLMRNIDVAALEQGLADLMQRSGQARFAHHELELWRERLVADDAALTEYTNRYPLTDRQQLRTLIRSVRSRLQDPAPFRALFRYLRDNAGNHDAESDDASVPPTTT